MTKTEEFVRRVLQRIAKKSQKRGLAYKQWKLKRNRGLYRKRRPVERHHNRRGYGFDSTRYFEEQKFNRVIAPRNFSFRHRTEDAIAFIARLRHLFDDQKKVFVSLRSVQYLDFDAIVVLFSVMIRFKAKKIAYNGDFPINSSAKNILDKSGFILKLLFEEQEQYTVGKENAICTHGNTRIDQEQTALIIENAAVSIWGEKRRCPGVQRTLIELMQNTWEHADIEYEGKRHWWLSVNHDKDNRVVRFSFIDYGVGVFKSLDSKKVGSKYHGGVEKLKRAFSINQDSDVFRKIMEGELHATASSKPHRGKGLPGLKLSCERNQIRNLHIITNKVSADVTRDVYKDLKKSLVGTFVYFELAFENQNFPVEHETKNVN